MRRTGVAFRTPDIAPEPVASEPIASDSVAAEPVASEGGASKRGASVNWASLMADEPLHKIGECLLVNEEYYFIGFCRGIIVLAQKNPPHKIRLLNPLTKTSNTMFEAQMPSVFLDSVAVMKSPTMVFVSTHYPEGIASVDESTPTKDIYEDWGEGRFSIEHHSLRCITTFNGELYAIVVDYSEDGQLVCTNVQLEQRASTVKMGTLISFPELGNDKFYLVKSDGDLLLVLLDNMLLEDQPLIEFWQDDVRKIWLLSCRQRFAKMLTEKLFRETEMKVKADICNAQLDDHIDFYHVNSRNT
ncbi:hypothetical protein QYE76_033824 [Lolium multiflorum]|uniref:KIB1-4 beta-propeller domain-containing protein n=1 Tax=Lolium multiflorum TaxID=4521 RepID=A0AAD8QXS8_LOLMU|nr:hypothetical protein QYE76_033824 [Lolium multiflorum]